MSLAYRGSCKRTLLILNLSSLKCIKPTQEVIIENNYIRTFNSMSNNVNKQSCRSWISPNVGFFFWSFLLWCSLFLLHLQISHYDDDILKPPFIPVKAFINPVIQTLTAEGHNLPLFTDRTLAKTISPTYWYFNLLFLKMMLLRLNSMFWTAGEIFKMQQHERLLGNARADAERRCRTLAFVLSTEQPLRAASVAADSCYITWQNTSTPSCI